MRAGTRRARILWAGGLLILGLAVAAHGFFWYWPRPRALAPSAATPLGATVLGSEGLPYRLWIPYPHQNLTVAANRLGGIEGLLESVEKLIGMRSLQLPTFGPFRFPPAHEMVVSTDRDGEQLMIAARMYPTVARLLRAAGRLAGNAWLSGGRVDHRGRSLEVRWRGDVWQAFSNERLLRTSSATVAARSAFALLRLGEVVGPVPAGLYELTLSGDGWGVAMPAAPQPPFASAIFGRPSAAAFWARFESTDEAGPIRAMAVFAGSGDRSTVPSLVTLQSGSGDRWPLPGERILALADLEVVESSVGRWSLAAYDQHSIEKGVQLLGLLEELSGQATRIGLRTVVELDLEAARRALRSLGELLEAVPAVGGVESGRWLALSELLEKGREFKRLSIRIAAAPDRFELRIWY